MTKQTEPENFDLRSHDIVEDRIAELLRLFPEIRTEGGKLDFDRLKLALGESVDVGRERYGMNWPGKADCFKTIQAPSMGTLRPCREESVNFDTTENMIIEGDNLEVLKLLQKSYLGKVKMIYIDPPYNTGNDFIYPDNYSESLQTYLEYTGQVDDEGRKYGSNTEADGRFHSKWMNMMYPRLYLARNLLRDDGVIFISIDDNEVENSKRLCNELFGEENFVACILWHKKYAPANDTVDFSASHDFLLVYAKSRPLADNGRTLAVLSKLERTEEQNRVYKNPDNDDRGLWRPDNYTCNKTADERPNLYYGITQPTSGEQIWPAKTRVWAYSKDIHEKNVREKRIWWGVNGENKVPSYKRFLTEVGGIIADTWWDWKEVGHNDEAKKELLQLLPELSAAFETPKPTRLLRRAIQLASKDVAENGMIVLDFFAGSGTTGQAVLEENLKDGLSRKFILVQLPEKTERPEFRTIAEITKERVRRTIEKARGGNGNSKQSRLNLGHSEKLDLGFRVFKLDQSNFNTWNANVTRESKAIERQLDLHIDHIRDGRSSDDILYELLLKSGFPLTTSVESVQCSVFSVQQETENRKLKTENLPSSFSIAGGAMIICLERNLTLELIRAIADLKPERVVFLDEGFAGNDQLKANAVQTFKTKGVASFRTV